MLTPVNISDGQVSGVDDLSAAASSVINWETDEASISRPRAVLTELEVLVRFASGVSSAATAPYIGADRWKTFVVAVNEDREFFSISDVVPGVLVKRSFDLVGGVAPRVTFAEGATNVYVAGGAQISYWNGGTFSIAELASSPDCTHIAILGQRLISNDLNNPHAFRWSDIGEAAWGTWPAENGSAADSRPDPVVGVFENGSELFIMGSTSIQVYALGSDPTFPYELVTTLDGVGLGAPYACTRIGAQLAILDDKRRILTTDGRSENVISDAIQRDLRGLTTINDCFMYRETRGQQDLLVVRFPTETRTFVYDLKGQKWSERKYYSSPFQTDWPVNAYASWPALNQHFFGSALDGSVYVLDEDSRTEFGGALVCERTSGWNDFGIATKKRSSRVRVFMRRGTAAQGATPGSLEIRVQDDDSAWTPWEPLTVGAPEDFEQAIDTWGFNGYFKRRRYAIRFSTTENYSLVSLSDDIQDTGAP